MRKYFQVFLLTLRRKGGILRAFRTAVAIANREGWSGIRRKFLALSFEASNTVSSEFDRNDYTEWIRRYDSLTDDALSELRRSIDSFPRRPLISILLPTHNPNVEWLNEAIISVQRQVYPNWELCIADDCSKDTTIRPLLQKWVDLDVRIKTVFRKDNGHISAASNSALGIATGEWIALLDHDDLISEDALYYVAKCIIENNTVRLIYSDEDKIDECGRRNSPYFKCDWNPDLFLHHNMFCHLGVYNRELVEKIGGFRRGLEGAQDYDLTLRCVELLDERQIVHIPRILYHWRSHSKSTAQSSYAKPYSISAAEQALNEHFDRQGVKANSEFIGRGYRIRYDLPSPAPLVSLILFVGRSRKRLEKCVTSIIRKTTYPNYEIVLLSTGSEDSELSDYINSLAMLESVRVYTNSKMDSSHRLTNAVVDSIDGDIIGLIANDIEVISNNWLTELVSLAWLVGVGAVGAKLRDSDNNMHHGGYILGMGPNKIAGHSHSGVNADTPGYYGRLEGCSTISAVSSECLIIQKNIFVEVGGLGKYDCLSDFQGIDFCLRVRDSGYRNIWTPNAELRTQTSEADRGGRVDDTLSAAEYMVHRWGELLKRDPAYSPNLTLNETDFSLAWPPRVDRQSTFSYKSKFISDSTQAVPLAVVVHVFYVDIFEELLAHILQMGVAMKIYITTLLVHEEHLKEMLENLGVDFEIRAFKNHGRDVLPFLKILPQVIMCGHEAILKLHTKKSTLRHDGEAWRRDIYEKLISRDSVKRIMPLLDSGSGVGMVGPEGHIIPMREHWGRNRSRVIHFSHIMGLSTSDLYSSSFIAGTMFYARASVFKPLLDLGLEDDNFEPELGQTDGTMAHVVERLFSLCTIIVGENIVDSNCEEANSKFNKRYKYSD